VVSEVAGEHPVALEAVSTAALTTIPVAVFLFATWLLMLRPLRDRTLDAVLITATVLTLATTFLPSTILWAAAVMVLTVGVVVTRGIRLVPADAPVQVGATA
jgi:hypothetical protein